MAGEPLRIVVNDESETVHVDPDTGSVTTLNPDGTASVELDKKQPGLGSQDDKEWFRNLVDDLDGIQLSILTNDLVAGVKADNESRSGWLNNTKTGFDLLGLQLESPSADVSSTGDGPIMSKVKNPLLASAVFKSWANAEAELLPAGGPVKIKNDGHETASEDGQAEILERAMNHYLTVRAPEYYPQTSHMLLWGTIFRGSGFKKVYRCPRRRRPVAEKVDGKDLIVSDASTDFKSCGRITHEIEMRPSVFKLMQYIGAYRKTAGETQPNPEPNVVDSKVAAIQGTDAVAVRPEDKPYTLWETQCELDLDDFVPNSCQFKDKGIPLPYLVTIDKDSEEILAIRRDWLEDDKWCMREAMYFRYPYIPGPGFYCTGLLNLLGNASAAMTAAWREALDAGMFANFPGGFIDKRLVRGKDGGNANTTFQFGPGEFVPLDGSGLADLSKGIFTGVYRDVTSGLMTLMEQITGQSKELGGVADIPAAEGVANVPVGTMMAQIEQATKVIAAAHKGMHAAQSEELQRIVELFRRHPEDLLADSASPAVEAGWDEAQLLAALKNHKLVPVSDPNVPSHIHRVAKALGLIQLMPLFPGMLDQGEVLRRVLAAIREDPAGLLVPNPQPPPPEVADQAKMIDAQAKAKKVDADIAGKGAENQLKMNELQTDMATRQMDLEKEQVIHAHDAEKSVMEAQKAKADMVGAVQKTEQAENASKRQAGLGLVNASLKAHEIHAKSQQAAADHALGVHQANQQHALGVHQANQQAQQSEQDHALGVAEHGRESQKDQNQHKVAEKQANKPTPTKPKKES